MPRQEYDKKNKNINLLFIIFVFFSENLNKSKITLNKRIIIKKAIA
ncbi:TPA: hypothetical protein R9125_001784 [Campylobacter jejuni]|nr:hypothetical protein [Campylobacter jejuni]